LLLVDRDRNPSIESAFRVQQTALQGNGERAHTIDTTATSTKSDEEQ